MNRYQSYTPISINYKPFIPNFDKWFEVLDTQQKKFDEFNQQLSMLNADSELDPEYADAWNTYIQTTKDQVKAGFRGDVNEGNQLMRRKMEELTKEVTTGLYKDMETRKQDFSLASADFNEKIKGQSAQRQAYFLDQWKYEKSMYDKEGKLNRINAPNVSEDPLLDKNLQEWASKLKPEEVETKVKQIRYFQDKDGKTVPMVDSKGQFTGSAQWIDEAYRYTKGIKREDFNVMAQQYIMSNPAFIEDVQIRAWYQEKQMDPIQKENLRGQYIDKKQKEISDLNKAKFNLLEGKRGDGTSKLSSQELLFLNRSLLLRESDEFDEELKEAIEKQYNPKIEYLGKSIENYSDRGALIEEIMKDLIGSVYNLVESSHKEHDLFDINPDYQMRFKAANDHIENELNRQNSLRRAQISAAARIRAAEMLKVPVETPDVGYGFEQTIPTGSGETNLLTIYQKTKEGSDAADKELKSTMNELGFGSSNTGYRSSFEVDRKNSAFVTDNKQSDFRFYEASPNSSPANPSPKEIYKKAQSLPSNLAKMDPAKARAVLKEAGFNISDEERPYEYAIKINEFKNAYDKQTTYKQQFDKLTAELNEEGALDKMNKWIADKYENYKGSIEYQKEPLGLNEFSNRVVSGDMNFTVKYEGARGEVAKIETDAGKQFKNVFYKNIESLVKFQTNSYDMASGYSNPNPKSEAHRMSKALVPVVLNHFRNTSLLIDPVNNSTPSFKEMVSNGEFKNADKKEALEAYSKAKSETTTVYPITVGGVPSYNIAFTDSKTGKVYTVTTAAPASHHKELAKYAKNQLNEAKRTGNEAAAKYATDLYASLIDVDISPFKGNPDYYATEENIVGSDNSSTKGKVLNKFNENGLTYGVVKKGNIYYSAVKGRNGWEVVPINNGIVYSATDPMEVTRSMLGEILYTQDYKISGKAEQINPIVRQQQNDDDELDDDN